MDVCVRVCVTMIYRKIMCERAYKLFLVVVDFDYKVCVCVCVCVCEWLCGWVCVCDREIEIRVYEINRRGEREREESSYIDCVLHGGSFWLNPIVDGSNIPTANDKVKYRSIFWKAKFWIKLHKVIFFFNLQTYESSRSFEKQNF